LKRCHFQLSQVRKYYFILVIYLILKYHKGKAGLRPSEHLNPN
jgi:hypothetical protein